MDCLLLETNKWAFLMDTKKERYLCANLKKGRWVIDLQSETKAQDEVTIYRNGSWIKEFVNPVKLMSVYDIQFWEY